MAVVANEFPERLRTVDSLDSDSDIWTPLDSDNDIDGNPRLHWFSLTSLCDLSRNPAPLSRQIILRKITPHDIPFLLSQANYFDELCGAFRKNKNAFVFFVSSSQAKINIIAGCCMAMGLRFAGSANQEAFNCLVCVGKELTIGHLHDAVIWLHLPGYVKFCSFVQQFWTEVSVNVARGGQQSPF